MKKIIFLLVTLLISSLLVSVGYAETNRRLDDAGQWRNATSTATSTPSTLNLSCVQTAVTTRETSVINAYEVMSTSIKTALVTRQSELTAAWGITDNQARRTARKAAWDKFNKASREARKIYKASIKTTWRTFHSSSKACRVNTQGVESESADLSL